MSSWLGVRGYRFKHTMLSVATKYTPSQQLAQRIAGHQNIRTTSIYTEEAFLAVNLELCSKLAVLGLHPRFGVFDPGEVTEFMNKFAYPSVPYTDFN